MEAVVAILMVCTALKVRRCRAVNARQDVADSARRALDVTLYAPASAAGAADTQLSLHRF